MRGLIGVLVAASALALATGVSYAHELGHTTEDHTIQAGGPLQEAPTFETLVEGPGQPRVVRGLATAAPLAGRAGRRVSLSYFAQLTDFQVADEESPARVEFVDRGPSSAWRPHEAFHPWAMDYSFRQLNQFTPASPHTQAAGVRAPMDLALLTGDLSDNQQLNETVWVRQLIEGGSPITPNSGVRDYTVCPPTSRAQLEAREIAGQLPDEPIYMGVQDYDDLGFQASDYWDPDEPFGQFEGWPRWPGLMDRAQALTFTPVGLRNGGTPVPTYVSNGNHDGLVQGNEDAVRAFEDIATGCFKAAASTMSAPVTEDPDPNRLLTPPGGFPVRPDAQRQFVDRRQLKEIYSSGSQADGHGFDFVPENENAASRGSATYFARELKPGIMFVSIDTVSDGGVVEQSSQGNIDNPQWQWLQTVLDRAEDDGDLVVAFGHHPIRSLVSAAPDEAAQPCTTNDAHDHDQNPGCDLDPRPSEPLHLGDDLATLLSSHSNVIAYVAGHTHENKVLACGSAEGCPPGGNWWEINTSAAAADWPQQSRLIELMDNRDGTLSILGTLTDFAAPLGVPPDGADASGFGNDQLASISHAVAFNDPQVGDGRGEGAAEDQNVELLVDDPRTTTVRGTGGDDQIRGTSGRDVIICGPGNDRVRAGRGNDIIRCGPGHDIVWAGRGRDRVSGDSGRDLLFGGPGGDRLFGRSGRDRVFGQGGNDRGQGNGAGDLVAGHRGRDRVSGGRGRDRVSGGIGPDRVFGGPASDRLFGRTGADRLLGGAAADRLSGGRGNDLLVGGPGADLLFGGRGRDRRRQ